ncbi:MAG: hypothetical protein CMN78_04715 [Spirochaetales bacterium]|nr:hypothetical protein [Spirochaetales bacterium]
MKLVDSVSMTEIDRRAQEEYGVPGIVLMENAGAKAYSMCREIVPSFISPDSQLLFVAGKGNNGGDALVMARHAFNDGLSVRVLMTSSSLGKDCELQFTMVRKLGVPVISWSGRREMALDAIRSANVIVDGIYGTGIRGAARGETNDIIAAINEADGFTVGLDVPSGIGDEFRKAFLSVKADATLCLGLPKKGLYLPAARQRCGIIAQIPIGFPRPLVEDPMISGELLSHGDIGRLLPSMPDDAYKNSRGKLAVFAGTTGTTGAAILSASAAARSRCGLVFLFVDSEAFGIVASQLVSVMPYPWDATGDARDFNIDDYSAYVVGPGWGFEHRAPWLRRLLDSAVPGVVDADAITLLSRMDDVPDLDSNVILTPHPGEMSRLAGISSAEVLDDPVDAAVTASKRYNAFIVLKSHVTTISDPDGRYSIIDGMNPAMGTGGSGDILSGIIGGIIAGGVPPTEAARLGVLIHDSIGKTARKECGWFISQDLLPYISRAFGKY